MSKKPYTPMVIMGAIVSNLICNLEMNAFIIMYTGTLSNSLKVNISDDSKPLLRIVITILVNIMSLLFGAGFGVLWVKFLQRKDKQKQIKGKHYVGGIVLILVIISLIMNPIGFIAQILCFGVPVVAVILLLIGSGSSDGAGVSIGGAAGGGGGGGGWGKSNYKNNDTIPATSQEQIYHESPKICPFYEGRPSVGFSDICHAVRGKDTITYETYKKYCQWNCYACNKYQDNEKYYKQMF